MALEADGVGQGDVRAWAEGLDGLAACIGPHFSRRGARKCSMECIGAQLNPAERKNSWQLAEVTGDSNPCGLQDLLGRREWQVELDARQAEEVRHRAPGRP